MIRLRMHRRASCSPNHTARRTRRWLAWCAVAAALIGSSGCGTVVSGTPTWPGEVLQKMLLTAADFPAGVQFDPIREDPGAPDGAGSPPSMLSKPPGCANALTDVIAKSAERGPGSAAKYAVSYDGARIQMTVLSWSLNLDELAATASRCQHFETFFDPQSEGIPITTTLLPSSDGTLIYRQTMDLAGRQSSVYMAFANVGRYAVFGVVFPTEDPAIPVKATLPQTFTDVVGRQVQRMRAA